MVVKCLNITAKNPFSREWMPVAELALLLRTLFHLQCHTPSLGIPKVHVQFKTSRKAENNLCSASTCSNWNFGLQVVGHSLPVFSPEIMFKTLAWLVIPPEKKTTPVDIIKCRSILCLLQLRFSVSCFSQCILRANNGTDMCMKKIFCWS